MGATQEVLYLDGAVVGLVEGLVGLLDRGSALLELCSELAEEGVAVVERCLKLQAASLRECGEHAQEVHLFHSWLQTAPLLGSLCPTSSSGTLLLDILVWHPVDRLEDCAPEALELCCCGVETKLLDTGLELEARHRTRLVDVQHHKEFEEAGVSGLEDGGNLLEESLMHRGS